MKFWSLLFAIIFLASCNRDRIVNKKTLLAADFRLFQETASWTLAKAIEDEDISAIEHEILIEKVNIDAVEGRFGQTPLQLAIYNNKYQSVVALLKLGADPNIADKYRGTNAVIEAAETKLKYLTAVLNHGGEPNSLESAPVTDTNVVRKTAIEAAIYSDDGSSLEKAKLLVKRGDSVTRFRERRSKALEYAIMLDKMDVTLFLLQAGADYNDFIYEDFDAKKIYILGALRRKIYPLDSDEYKTKLEIIKLLKSRNLDYGKEPIPEHSLKMIKIEHPKDWQSYIKVY